MIHSNKCPGNETDKYVTEAAYLSVTLVSWIINIPLKVSNAASILFCIFTEPTHEIKNANF